MSGLYVGSAETVAALDGEVPGLLLVEITRQSIELRETAPALRILAPLVADRETVLRMRGRVQLCVSGYDSDARALVQILEFQAYAATFNAAWPYLAWFTVLAPDIAEHMPEVLGEVATLATDGALMPWLLAASSDALPPVASERAQPNERKALGVNRARLAETVGLYMRGILNLADTHQLHHGLVTARLHAFEDTLERTGVI